MNEQRGDVTLHIGELILEGIEVADPARLQAAVERELTRLVSEHGLNPTLSVRGTAKGTANLNAASIRIAPGARAETLGAQIASAVYSRLRG